ncbi:hypothetical protein AMTRI_Chr01g130670 [Amborella trichopoda]|uniref:BHLH domain-containing protein n=1 Tax=Amborella trichopoda TaxID=13333 RepID=W1PMA5_AMBTC|nr:transcription factor SPEECHLESS isoform X2 [Amborella trichopoda]ERN08919.1 hypothetical protein AMTR_s00015p00239460 [Amborella trichopoda]|eukprot:XP_006847338.1 transcription factor SPEECHLESS isoform X2 [Amborella trichopoda]
MGHILPEFFDPEFSSTASSPENLFSILEALDNAPETSLELPLRNFALPALKEAVSSLEKKAVFRSDVSESETDTEKAPCRKKLKMSAAKGTEMEETAGEGGQRISHITVERNRRKQMNEHLTVLRSLMPCFYVKRGDQASVIGGVVDYINELQQVLQSLEARKQRKVYSEVLSPMPASSPRPALSPRIPISPRTPQPSSPYRTRVITPPYLSPSSSHEMPPTLENVSELAANSKSPVADVEVKFSGANVLLKTVSHRIPGQVLKIITALEDLSLEILHLSINTIEETMLNSFTIKIGIECELSAEELAHEIQRTFC